jgi:hypothetical protein
MNHGRITSLKTWLADASDERNAGRADERKKCSDEDRGERLHDHVTKHRSILSFEIFKSSDVFSHLENPSKPFFEKTLKKKMRSEIFSQAFRTHLLSNNLTVNENVFLE